MNDVGELKEFATVHARAQQIPRAVVADVLGRIVHDDSGSGSWVGEWSRVAQSRQRQGDLLAASRLYTMARFPYPGDPARQVAWERAVAAFDAWRSAQGVDLRPVEVKLSAGEFRCWATGPAPRAGQPFVILMGGIVSTKEQWAPTLVRLNRLGVAGVVTEMPGVGDNTLPYDATSWRMVPALLDAVTDQATTPRVHAMAMSFSGHLALRCALDDPRIASVLTVGAPLRYLFTDERWQGALPRVTVDTLAHLTGSRNTEVGGHIRSWALTPEQLGALDIPVAYIASRRDEIIPPQDIALLRRHVRRLDLLEFDDVHASPRHVGVTGPWLTLELLRMHGAPRRQRAALRAALIPLRAGTRLSAARNGRHQ